jgi:hypothetical protein
MMGVWQWLKARWIVLVTLVSGSSGLRRCVVVSMPLSAPRPAVVPEAVQRLTDLTPTQVARRPEGGRVDWNNVIPMHPNNRQPVAVAPPASHGDRTASDPDPDPDSEVRP